MAAFYGFIERRLQSVDSYDRDNRQAGKLDWKEDLRSKLLGCSFYARLTIFFHFFIFSLM